MLLNGPKSVAESAQLGTISNQLHALITALHALQQRKITCFQTYIEVSNEFSILKTQYMHLQNELSTLIKTVQSIYEDALNQRKDRKIKKTDIYPFMFSKLKFRVEELTILLQSEIIRMNIFLRSHKEALLLKKLTHLFSRQTFNLETLQNILTSYPREIEWYYESANNSNEQDKNELLNSIDNLKSRFENEILNMVIMFQQAPYDNQLMTHSSQDIEFIKSLLTSDKVSFLETTSLSRETLELLKRGARCHEKAKSILVSEGKITPACKVFPVKVMPSKKYSLALPQEDYPSHLTENEIQNAQHYMMRHAHASHKLGLEVYLYQGILVQIESQEFSLATLSFIDPFEENSEKKCIMPIYVLKQSAAKNQKLRQTLASEIDFFDKDNSNPNFYTPLYTNTETASPEKFEVQDKNKPSAEMPLRINPF